MSKRTELEATIDDLKPDVIGVTESWCNSTIMDSEAAFDNYVMFRLDKDSPSGRGGGVILYIHESLSAVACHEINNSNDFNSSVWCLIELERNEKLLVGLCYRSPNSTDQNNRKLLEQLEESAKVVNATHLLLIGDYNFSEINWKQGKVESGGDTDEAQKFFDTTQDLYLVQHVIKPTRNRGDYVKIKSHFKNVNWEEEFKDKTCNEAWNIFKEEYETTIQEHVPLKKKKSKKPPWLKSGVKRSIRKKYNMYQRYRKTQQYKDYEAYRKQSNITKRKVRRAQVDYEKKIMRDFKKKPKAFYSYVRAKQKVKTGVSQLENDQGDLTKTDKETADVLNSFFQSVFTQEPDGEPPTLADRKADIEELIGADFTLENVMKKLDKLKQDKSPGIDQVHANVLKECKEEMAVPLFMIFKKSLEEGCIPDDWKLARVSPIFKKG
ncbi:uncharacterized protein [Amphiura filiformis]|uniref:uncharacterized protein n=1 Tax=Amphiura filiformis TaxID=82378 RepID=UPI003B220B3B